MDFISSRTKSRAFGDDLTDEEKDAMIVRFAEEYGGTSYDFDEALQEAALESIAEDLEVDR